MKAIVPKKTHIHAGRYATPRTGKGRASCSPRRNSYPPRSQDNPQDRTRKIKLIKPKNSYPRSSLIHPGPERNTNRLPQEPKPRLSVLNPHGWKKKSQSPQEVSYHAGHVTTLRDRGEGKITPRTHIHAGLCSTLRTVKGNVNDQPPEPTPHSTLSKTWDGKGT